MKKNQQNCPNASIEEEGKKKKGLMKKIFGVFGFMASRFVLLAIGIGVGIVISTAIVRVRAAWDSHVFPGDTITAAGWNDIVDKLVDLDGRWSSEVNDCQWIDAPHIAGVERVYCPAGYVVTGIYNTGPDQHIDGHYCCRIR